MHAYWNVRDWWRSWGVLTLLSAAQFMVVLDVSVVNVALPVLRSDLGLDAEQVPWIAGAYAVVFAGFLLLGGRLGDLLGRSRVLLVGLAVFVGASAVGGFAWDGWVLVLARAVQGLGAALVAPNTLSILTAHHPRGPRRTRALAVWTALGSLGGAAGSLVGGVLVELASWRWILLVNVAVGVVLLPLARARLADRDDAPARGEPVDALGAVLGTAAVVATMQGLGGLSQRPVVWPTVLWAVCAIVCAAAFLVVEHRERAAPPLFPLRLLRYRSVSVGNAIMLLSGAALALPVWYFLTFLMQDGLGFTALQTGLGFLPHTLLGVALGTVLTPWLMRRIPSRRLVAAGALVTAVGFGWQSGADPSAGYVGAVLGPAIALSLGGALFVTPLTSLVLSEAPDDVLGAVSGLMSTAKQMGGVLGLAVLALVAGDAGVSGDPVQVAAASSRVFAVMGGALVVVAGLALLLPARSDRGDERAASPGSERASGAEAPRRPTGTASDG